MDSIYFSREELEALILGLTDTDILRLRQTACTYTGSHDLEADDLVQEAIVRVLSGDRKSCPSNIPVIIFIIGIMKSIANGERNKNKVRVAYAEKNEDADFPGHQHPECPLVEAERLNEIESIFEDDEDVLLLFMHLQEGNSPSEIQSAEEWDKTKYDTVRRRARRKWNAYVKRELIS